MRFRNLSAAALLVLSAGACTSWRTQPGPAPEAIGRLNGSGTVRVTRRDMSVLVMSAPMVVGDSIVGIASSEPPQRAAVAIADVQRIDAKRVSATKTGGLAVGTVLIVSVVAVAAALAALLGSWN